LWHSGWHPITKQKIGSILILADPKKKEILKIYQILYVVQSSEEEKLNFLF
jgi:hypothetical protein